MRREAVLGFCLLCLLAGCLGPTDRPTSYNATVVGVIDGDTIDVRLADGREERVRLLGVDTPEVAGPTSPGEFAGVPNTTAGRACLRAVGENASAFVRSQVDGKSIHLEIDPRADRRGGFGRLLAYVFENGTHLNRGLLARGYARVFDTEFGRRAAFESARDAARAANRGVWSCRDPPG